WMQTLITHAGGLATVGNWVYIWGHWPVIIATMVWLVARHSDIFRRLRDAMMISGAVGMVIFATFPVAPPRLADPGMIDTVSERSHAYRVLQPPAFVNQYAAMPSLHAGWDLLIGISIVAAASTVALKIIGFSMPILMALAVVVTANHYVLDVVAGVALVLVAHALALALERRRHRRRRRQAGLDPARADPGTPVAGDAPVLAIAHRAGNTLAGLETANLLGADVIECDVHEHHGRLEVRHLKTAGPLPFLWDKWELVPASAPRLVLAELLDADRHGTTFMLDLKGRRPSTGRAVVDLLHESGIRHPVLVCSRHWPLVDAFADVPYVRRVLSARNRGELTRLLRRLASTGPVHGVSVHRSLLDRDVVAELNRRVDVVMTWPVNDVVSLDHLLEIGVTGIISDENQVLSELIRRQVPQPGRG
nr:glycerophosphodiester phosphodiesterase [Aeromicrobium sp.]